jgi:ABC-type Fe3+/spermidine/putrescine transport system ATPase subunit
VTVLEGTHLTIAPGEINALVGQNGSGKSTLIKVISGVYSADPGCEILLDGERIGPPIDASALHGQALSCVHQDLGLVDDLTAQLPRTWSTNSCACSPDSQRCRTSLSSSSECSRRTNVSDLQATNEAFARRMVWPEPLAKRRPQALGKAVATKGSPAGSAPVSLADLLVRCRSASPRPESSSRSPE